MTRKEELERIARDYENKIIENNPSAESYDYMNAVIYGAEWADKTMIDKACKYIEENFIDADEKGVVKSYDFDSVKDMLDNFRKTME